MDNDYIKAHLKRLTRLMQPDKDIRVYARWYEDEQVFRFGAMNGVENRVSRQVAIYLIINKILHNF
jgi:hypothetical protein